MGHTMTAQQPYPDFNKEKVTDSSEKYSEKTRASHYSWGFNISIKYLSPDTVFFGFQPLHAFLSSLSRFIRRTKRFRPFGYACVSVGLLQSPAADCIVRYSGPYSLLQWTVQSIAEVCNNLPFKRP